MQVVREPDQPLRHPIARLRERRGGGGEAVGDLSTARAQGGKPPQQDHEDAQGQPQREVQVVTAQQALVERRKARGHVQGGRVVERDRLLGARLLKRATAAVFEAHVLQVGEVDDLEAEVVAGGHLGGEAERVVEGHL